ncbi:MAG: hypothetical protein QXJ06_00655 [Candidatus Aenigmatarchaeota archaeon]
MSKLKFLCENEDRFMVDFKDLYADIDNFIKHSKCPNCGSRIVGLLCSKEEKDTLFYFFAEKDKEKKINMVKKVYDFYCGNNFEVIKRCDEVVMFEDDYENFKQTYLYDYFKRIDRDIYILQEGKYGSVVKKGCI